MTVTLPASGRHLAALDVALRDLHANARQLERWGTRLARVLCGGGRLLAAGNGGSAAQAQHLTAELVGRYRDERKPLSALPLCVEPSAVTAIANDYGVEQIFARQVDAHGRPGDVLIPLSTSGRSPNVLAAAAAAREGGLRDVGAHRRGAEPARRAGRRVGVDRLAVHRDGAGGAPDRGPPGLRGGRRRAGAEGGGVSRLVVVGDALLDRDLDGRAERLAPDAPVPVVDAIAPRERPGGAGLAALLAARDGHAVTLVCALGADPAGARVRELLAAAGVAVCDLGLLGGETPEKARVRAGGRPVVRLDRGGGTGCGPLTTEARTALAEADAVLVSDYGRGVAAAADVRAALGAAPVVWDPHPRGPAPVPGCVLVTPNAAEAARFAGEAPSSASPAAEACARVLRERWQAVAVAVTRGAGGALLVAGPGPALAAPAEPAAGGDPCGAGDRFAATAAGRIAAGALPTAAVVAAVAAASRFVADGRRRERPPRAAAAPRRRRRARSPPASAREGGTVVATGGCFDLLHAGHVRALAGRARARRLPDRVPQLRRLGAPPARAPTARSPARTTAAPSWPRSAASTRSSSSRRTTRARCCASSGPHVWAKGGDYAVADLPEAATLAEWGGRVVLVPYVAGRSTTNLIDEARRTGREERAHVH